MKTDLIRLLTLLSDKSRFGKSILIRKKALPRVKPLLKKRKSKAAGEIRVFIASASDTERERQNLLERLAKRFQNKGFVRDTSFRLHVTGWEQLAPQPGKAQDIINIKLLRGQVDVIIGILKHKLGTPVRHLNNRVRSVSGTAEEISYAEHHPEDVLPMVYVYAQPPSLTEDDATNRKVLNEWSRMRKYRRKIQGNHLYKHYENEEKLLDEVVFDLKKNIEQYFYKD